MNILLMTGTLLPQPNNNSNLISKIIPYLNKTNELKIIAPAFGINQEVLPDTVFDVDVHWVTDSKHDFRRNYIMPTTAKLEDRSGLGDALYSRILARNLSEWNEFKDFDAVIATCEPVASPISLIKFSGINKLLFIMDPPPSIRGETEYTFRNRNLRRILASQDVIFTTPFIRTALNGNGYGEYDNKIVPVGFPMIEKHKQSDIHVISTDNGKINLLFCGWMYSDIRSPKYFLDIVSKLDERFCIYFMGKECDKLCERFDFKTKAEVVTLPQQPYQTAIDAMFDADILINIGNSVPVHMPSKTLEYINSGKPMVNFYKLDDCPTKYYTERYPLCLNLFEGDVDIDNAAEKFIDFCLTQKGKTVEREYIEREFADCTPQYIAQLIIDKLGDM